MVSLETPVCDFGAQAIDFSLRGVDGKVWTLEQCRGEKGLLVMFICNHCPYVKAIRDRLVRDTLELRALGVNSVAIMSNDPAEYAEDFRIFCERNPKPCPLIAMTKPGDPLVPGLGDDIDLRHEFIARFAAHVQLVQAPRIADCGIASAAGGLNRCIQ